MLMFVGYQAEGTFGRRIQKGWKEMPISENGKNIMLPIRCEVATVEWLSGHSDYKQLINYIFHLRARPERIICNTEMIFRLKFFENLACFWLFRIRIFTIISFLTGGTHLRKNNLAYFHFRKKLYRKASIICYL